MSWQEETPIKRFAHKSRGDRKQRGQANGSDFKPQNMIGKYAVQSSFFTRLSSADDMWLEIHELVASDTAYLASFDFGAVTGMMIIAGSRKSLRNAVDEMDEPEQEEEESGEQSEEDNTAAYAESDGQIAFVMPNDLDRPQHAFEKNTFKTPKWFARWRGRVDQSKMGHLQLATYDDAATHNAHLEFSTAACDDFQATFSCAQLGAKDAAWKGRKMTSKPSAATSSWADFA